MKYRVLVILMILAFSFELRAQEVLPLSQAVDVAMKQNSEIKIAKNNLKMAENNASVLNSGYLPSVTANAAAQKRLEDTHVALAGGTDRYVNDAITDSYNYGVTLNYTIFDGLGRMYNYKKLKSNYDLSELQSRQVIENKLMDLISTYFEVSKLQSKLENQIETLKYSKDRKDRAEEQYKFGQTLKLDVLKAKVDYNNDSINYLNIKRDLALSIRNFNVILSRDVKTEFVADTAVVFNLDINEEKINDLALNQNIDYLIAEQQLNIAKLDVKSNRSGFLPKIDLSGGYNYNNTKSDGGAFTLNETDGFNARAGLTWSLFDGGNTSVRVQNAKIAQLNAQETLELLKIELERRVSNAFVNYQNALVIMDAEQLNLETNKLNFEYTLEKYKLGQVNSLDFRKSQVDLLDSENRFNDAKYGAKLAELELLKLAGLFLQELEVNDVEE